MNTRTLILTVVASAALAVPVSQASARNALKLSSAHLGLAAAKLGTDAGQHGKGGIGTLVVSPRTCTVPAVFANSLPVDASVLAQANPVEPGTIGPDDGDGEPQ
jgi:hypothetical protein